jgi:hypothetical protein
MVRTKLWLAIITSSALGLAVGCSKSSPNLTSPSTVRPGAPRASSDGSTLKVTAPIPQSPINNQQISTGNDITLVVTNASASFSTPAALTYRFEIYNAAGIQVYRSSAIAGGSAGTTSHLLPETVGLEGEQQHAWRARAEFEGETGPWSDTVSFIPPNTTGYVRGNELYDPLTNGKTIGQIHGPVTFIPGVGAKLESQVSYISYQLGATLTEGEFSILITGMPTNTEGDKTKLFAMAEGYSDIVTNDRRMTVEKRGNPAGIVAWRMITHDDRIETVGAERVKVNFNANDHYFWRATWRNNRFNVLINEGGVFGRTVYNFGKPFEGRAYDPSPHVIYIGAPIGRSGATAASVDHVIIRQVWVSGRPRPGFANH